MMRRWAWCAAVALALALGGCKLFQGTGVELCYEHPKYGAVCIKINGKEYKLDRPDLTPAQKAEIEADYKAAHPH